MNELKNTVVAFVHKNIVPVSVAEDPKMSTTEYSSKTLQVSNISSKLKSVDH